MNKVIATLVYRKGESVLMEICHEFTDLHSAVEFLRVAIETADNTDVKIKSIKMHGEEILDLLAIFK